MRVTRCKTGCNSTRCYWTSSCGLWYCFGFPRCDACTSTSPKILEINIRIILITFFSKNSSKVSPFTQDKFMEHNNHSFRITVLLCFEWYLNHQRAGLNLFKKSQTLTNQNYRTVPVRYVTGTAFANTFTQVTHYFLF